MVVPRRAHHRQQSDGRAPRLGSNLQRRLPALLRHDGARSALPERLRLPGALGRSRSREGTQTRQQARHRKPRSRRSLFLDRPLRQRMQGPRGQIRPHPDGTIDPPRLLDGLGPHRRGLGQVSRRAQVVLHDVGREQLHHLGLPQEVPSPRLHLRRLRRHAVVRPLRYRHQPAGDERRLQDRRPSLDLPALSPA